MTRATLFGTRTLMEEFKKEKKMKLSDQAVGALMMALQKCIMEQTDIVPLLGEMDFASDDSGDLIVENPPKFEVSQDNA